MPFLSLIQSYIAFCLQEHNLKAYKIAVRQILFQNCATFQFKGGTFMENVVIETAACGESPKNPSKNTFWTAQT